MRTDPEDPLTEAELKFRALQRDRKAWPAWCAGRRAAWLAKHPDWMTEREAREKRQVKAEAK